MPQPLRPVKRLGQNFLTDPNIARKIVDAVSAPPSARVVEIGPGTGALTGLLAARFPDFVAVEVDERAVALLRSDYPDLDVRHLDVLEVNWPQLAAEPLSPENEPRATDRPPPENEPGATDRSPPENEPGATDRPPPGTSLHVVGNLPYNITSQILFSLLEARDVVRSAVVMTQLEVAERIAAPPGSKTYGILSVILQQYAQVELLFRVSRNVFYPRPDVTSAVIRVTFSAEDRDVPFEAFRKVVRMAFNQRRKTLRNSLSALLAERDVVLPDRWAGSRAEELSPEEFVSLTQHIFSSHNE